MSADSASRVRHVIVNTIIIEGTEGDQDIALCTVARAAEALKELSHRIRLFGGGIDF